MMVKMSKIFKWDSGLSVSFDEIDEQHKEFINRLNRLNAALDLNQNIEEVRDAIQFLEEYVVKHFDMEEQHMKEFRYPLYQSHRMEHKKFVDRLHAWERTYERVEPNRGYALIIALQMGFWLLNHIKKVDRELGGFLNENKKI